MKAKLAYLCSSTSWGGLEMNHLRNASWMHQRGHDVTIFCVKGTPLAKETQERGLPVQFIEEHKKYYDFKKANTLAKLLLELGVTHLLIRSTFDMSIAAAVKRKLGHKIQTSYFMEMQLGVKKTNLLHTLRFRYIDLWSCPLNWLEEQVHTMTKFQNKTVVIPSGMDLSVFNQTLSKETARKQLDLPANKLVFGLIGRFDPQKGQLLLLEAMQKSQNKDYHVVLLGEPTMHEGDDYFQKMEAIIQQNDLQERVHVRPFMKDVTTFFKAVDWFVMATKAETFGMVTIESLACGTPVLGSNAGGTPEILNTAEGGCLFKTLDADDLAKQIDHICDAKISFDESDLCKMAEHYDHRKVCDMVEKVLKINA